MPKGPTLDPDVRRMAVHVEDHPLDYFDFEGVIPARRVRRRRRDRVGLGHVGARRGRRSASKAIEDGDLHFDLDGEKLQRPLRPRPPRGGAAAATSSGCCSTSTTTRAVKGWEPEEHPRSVKSGRTNDEVKAAPAATWSSSAIWAAPSADELAALDALGQERQVGSSASTRLTLTNLDKVLFPAKKPHRALTKRDLIRHYACIAPAMLPYLDGRPVNLHRYPDGIDEAGLLAQGSAHARTGVDHPLAERRRRHGRDRASTSCSTRRRRWRGSRTTARSSCTRGLSRAKTRTSRRGR